MGPERIREINSLRILHWLIDGSETTATEIAEHCDLSRTSVNAALANLRELGWITTLNAVTGTAGGRPARRYRFRSEGAVVLGADIGVHHVEVLLADLAGTALAQRSQAVDPDLDPPSRLAVLDRLIAEALSQAQLKAEDVHALTAAVSGVVDDSGRTPFETPLPQWHEVDLVARLRASFTCPVRISNSCKLALLEETRHGEAVGFTDVVHILADQRISAAIMSRGAVIEGSGGAAGEIGGLKILRWERAIRDLTAHPDLPELDDERERSGRRPRGARLHEDLCPRPGHRSRGPGARRRPRRPRAGRRSDSERRLVVGAFHARPGSPRPPYALDQGIDDRARRRRPRSRSTRRPRRAPPVLRGLPGRRPQEVTARTTPAPHRRDREIGSLPPRDRS